VELSTLLIPLLIFCAEVCVVTLGTLRIIFVARGQKVLAPLLGFFESFIWLVAISQIMRDHSDWTCFIAFGSGFALGNYLGICVEKRLALGTVIVRIITHRDAGDLITRLRGANFGVTAVEGRGASGKVQIVMTVVKRKQLPEVATLIETHHPSAFFSVDDLQSSSEGIFPRAMAKARPGIVPLSLVSLVRLVMPAADKPAELAGHGNGGADDRGNYADNPEPAPFR
jgi:uncharacterized protein YebE (UPF0316 family)